VAWSRARSSSLPELEKVHSSSTAAVACSDSGGIFAVAVMHWVMIIHVHGEYIAARRVYIFVKAFDDMARVLEGCVDVCSSA
jgi:hypothetical protein